MARGKSTKLAPFQKLLTIMVTGKPITVEEIDATLGKEIQMYRLSTYIWLIKTNANAVVKVIKNGRKITAYQVMNVGDVKDYLKIVGATSFTPNQSQTVIATKTKVAKAPKVTKLKDLSATPVVTPAVEVTTEKLEVTEVTA